MRERVTRESTSAELFRLGAGLIDPLLGAYLHLQDLQTGGDDGDGGLELVAGVGDELFLFFHALDDRTDGFAGAEDHEDQDQQIAADGNKTGNGGDALDILGVAGAVDEDDQQFFVRLRHPIPECAGFSFCFSFLCRFCGVLFCLALCGRGDVRDVGCPRFTAVGCGCREVTCLKWGFRRKLKAVPDGLSVSRGLHLAAARRSVFRRLALFSLVAGVILRKYAVVVEQHLQQDIGFLLCLPVTVSYPPPRFKILFPAYKTKTSGRHFLLLCSQPDVRFASYFYLLFLL